MHACIHASTLKMHQNILIVLDGLHSQKKVGKNLVRGDENDPNKKLRLLTYGRGGGAPRDQLVMGVGSG